MRETTEQFQEIDEPSDRAALFERYRARLFGIAYRMLGSVDDANDLTQETYLRWHQADLTEIRAPEGWLVTVMTRLSIDRLRRAETERESYIGHWLPEPLATGAWSAPDNQAELASDLSMAFLVLLERLAPEERAAFLLREVLDADYGEIARVLDKSEAACRQMVHRARARVRDDRPRFPVAADAKERLVRRFLSALEAGDQESLLAIVAEDATFVSDGGGRVQSVRNIIRGTDRIVRLVLGLERKWGAIVKHEIAWINGEPALVSRAGDRLVCTTSIAIDGDRLVGFFRVLNPDKLRHASPREGSVAADG
ncbi:MAG: RNA polymerase sigma-70 factor [Gemmatimonadaceae bacterium]